MGTYRSSYTMMPDGNKNNAPPNFQWFHPSFFSTSRTGFNPFQGSHHINSSQQDVRGSSPVQYTTIPVQLGPPDDVPFNNKTETKHVEPTKTPKKSSKASKKSTSDPLAPKPFKPKQSKKDPSKPKKSKSTTPSSSTVKRERRDLNFATYDGNVDLNGVPAPFCSCTGVARQCYRWGAGGWQSSCCTTNLSEYPLPMKLTRPGSRMAGRKMSHGAYEKLLQRLAAEGCDLSRPIDLKQHWARHGTNKFVTIR